MVLQHSPAAMARAGFPLARSPEATAAYAELKQAKQFAATGDIAQIRELNRARFRAAAAEDAAEEAVEAAAERRAKEGQREDAEAAENKHQAAADDAEEERGRHEDAHDGDG